jgi:alcohol dehydrogenase class IV
MQEEFISYGQLESLRDIVSSRGFRKIFAVTGRKSFSDSGASVKLHALPVPIVYYSDFTENITSEEIERGRKVFSQQKYDCIIAVGGGSVIDFAKMISVLAGYTGTMVMGLREAGSIIRTIPIIAIPTTSGSGSEATSFAVVYVDGVKHSFENDSLIPDVVILDAALTESQSQYQTAVSGMDAFSQAVESMWSVNSTEISRRWSIEAIAIMASNLVRAVQKPDMESRVAMMKAAHLAGKAINVTKTTAPHAFSYPITTYMGIPHGHACSVLLPFFAEYNFNVLPDDCIDSRGVDHVRYVIDEMGRILNANSVQNLRSAIEQIRHDIGLDFPSGTKVKYDEKAVRYIVQNVNYQRLANNPRRVTPEPVESFLLTLMK